MDSGLGSARAPQQAPTRAGEPFMGWDRHTFDEDRRILVAVFCGIDWAEDHHDIALVDQDGTLLARRRIGDDAAGFGALLQLLVEVGDHPDAPIPVAIETSHGLLVACLAPPGARCSRSTPCRCRATGIDTRWRGASPMPGTHWCWPISCAPTWPRTARCRPTPSWRRRSPSSPAPSRTRSGRGPMRTTSCARCCVSSIRPSCWRSPPSAADCCDPRPARCWLPPPPHALPPG